MEFRTPLSTIILIAAAPLIFSSCALGAGLSEQDKAEIVSKLIRFDTKRRELAAKGMCDEPLGCLPALGLVSEYDAKRFLTEDGYIIHVYYSNDAEFPSRDPRFTLPGTKEAQEEATAKAAFFDLHSDAIFKELLGTKESAYPRKEIKSITRTNITVYYTIDEPSLVADLVADSRVEAVYHVGAADELVVIVD